ncbi:hypothetical protein VYU27_009877 [Nannochloropsis oceanica]
MENADMGAKTSNMKQAVTMPEPLALRAEHFYLATRPTEIVPRYSSEILKPSKQRGRCECMEPHGHISVSLLHPPAPHPQELPLKDSLPPSPTFAPLTLSSIPVESICLSPPTSSVPTTRSSQNLGTPVPTNIRYRSHPQRALACLYCRRSKVKCDKKQPSCTRCVRLGVICEPQKRGQTTAPFKSLASAIANFPQSSFPYHKPSLLGSLHSDPPSQARLTFNQALRGHQHPQSHSQSPEPRVFTAHAKPARYPWHEAATDPCRQQLLRYNQLSLPLDVPQTLSSSSSSSLPSFSSSSSSSSSLSSSSSFPSSSFPSSSSSSLSSSSSSSSSFSSFSTPSAPVHNRLVTDSFLVPPRHPQAHISNISCSSCYSPSIISSSTSSSSIKRFWKRWPPCIMVHPFPPSFFVLMDKSNDRNQDRNRNRNSGLRH